MSCACAACAARRAPNTATAAADRTRASARGVGNVEARRCLADIQAYSCPSRTLSVAAGCGQATAQFGTDAAYGRVKTPHDLPPTDPTQYVPRRNRPAAQGARPALAARHPLRLPARRHAFRRLG